MRFSPDESPDQPAAPKVRAKVLSEPRKSPLAKSIAAVPDATLRFLLGNPAEFDGADTRKAFLAWADKHGRTNDSDWRQAWSQFLHTKTSPPSTSSRATPHPWAARLKLAAA